MRPSSIKSPAPNPESLINSSPRNAHAIQLWWIQLIHNWRSEDRLKSLDHALMTQREVQIQTFRRRKTRVLRIDILGWKFKDWEKQIPEIFALLAGPSWFLKRTLKLIFCFKYEFVLFSAHFNYILLDKIIV